jgi:hypothetical protein
VPHFAHVIESDSGLGGEAGGAGSKRKRPRNPSPGEANRGGAKARVEKADSGVSASLQKTCGDNSTGMNTLNSPAAACDGNCRHRMNGAFNSARACQNKIEELRAARLAMSNDERLDHLRSIAGEELCTHNK